MSTSTETLPKSKPPSRPRARFGKSASATSRYVLTPVAKDVVHVPRSINIPHQEFRSLDDGRFIVLAHSPAATSESLMFGLAAPNEIDRPQLLFSQGSLPIETPAKAIIALGDYQIQHLEGNLEDPFAEYDAYLIEDWDADGADAIPERTLDTAKQAFGWLRRYNWPLPHIAPATDGTIGFEWWNGSACLYLDFGPENLISTYINLANGEPSEENNFKWSEAGAKIRISELLRTLDLPEQNYDEHELRYLICPA